MTYLFQDNYTALHLAVESGKSSVVEALLGHGAQVHVRGGKIGEAPLHIACRIDEAKGEQCSKYNNPYFKINYAVFNLHISLSTI